MATQVVKHKEHDAKAAAFPSATANLQLALGIVRVPISLKPLIKSQASKGVSGKLICPEHHEKVNQKYVCREGTEDEHMMTRGDCISGYEVTPKSGVFVTVPEEQLLALEAEQNKTVEVDYVVPRSEFPDAYTASPYTCWPTADSGGEQQFSVLAATLRREELVIIGKVVLGGKTKPIAILWSELFGAVVAHTTHFYSDIDWGSLDLVKASVGAEPEPSDALIDAAAMFLHAHVGEFDPADVKDEYTAAKRELIAQAKAGELPETTEAAPATVPAPPKVDLLAQLQESLAQTQAEKKTAKPKKTPTSRKKAKAA